MKHWIKTLRDVPAWFVLFVLLLLLMTGYYIRPDNVTEDSVKAVLGALLLSIQHKRPQEHEEPSPAPDLRPRP